MRYFVWTVLVLYVAEAIGNAVLLKRGDFTRNPGDRVFDIAITFVLVVWGAYVLGSE